MRFKELDKGIMYGAITSALVLGVGVIGSLKGTNFIDLPSIFLVLGGTCGATLINYSPRDFGEAWRGFLKILYPQPYGSNERIRYLVMLSRVVRSQGVLALEGEQRMVKDPFLSTALGLLIDGQGEENIRRILETELKSSEESSIKAYRVLEAMGNFAPAFGLIGTLIGLVQMLDALSMPERVGPAMSLALLTTLYGALLSHLVLLPLAGKLRVYQEEEIRVKLITIEGVLSLARQENYHMVEQRLQSFLPLKAAYA